MAVTLNTAIALIDLADLKEYLKITHSDEDSELNQLINSVSMSFNTYCNRWLLLGTDLTEFYDGTGKTRLYLNRYPITSTNLTIEIYIDSSRSFAASTQITSTEIVVYDEEGYVVYTGGFPRGHKNIKVIYSGGIGPVGTATVLPEDIIWATREMCAFLRKREQEGNIGTSSVTYSNGGVTYDIDLAMPNYVKQVVDKYVRYV